MDQLYNLLIINLIIIILTVCICLVHYHAKPLLLLLSLSFSSFKNNKIAYGCSQECAADRLMETVMPGNDTSWKPLPRFSPTSCTHSFHPLSAPMTSTTSLQYLNVVVVCAKLLPVLSALCDPWTACQALLSLGFQ